ncbi:MAG TPA: hypothetical protein VF841_01075 [Anaeromyxobacter sp.]
MRRPSGVEVVASGVWLVVQLMTALRGAGAGIPPPALAAVSDVAAALALAAAIHVTSWAWRGPHLAAFPRQDLVVCAPPEAAAVRAAAQLRGTMGGAGHVYRLRLALPAAAWTSAAAVALAGPGLLEAAPPWVMLLGMSATASILFPAKPFFYRETTSGRVVLHPASALEELRRSAPEHACRGDERGAP